MGQLFKSFKRYNFKTFNLPFCLSNYSMSGAKIAFLLLVITMISASASAGECSPGCKICSCNVLGCMCLDSNLFGRSTENCKQRLEDCGSDVSCVTKVLLECAGLGR